MKLKAVFLFVIICISCIFFYNLINHYNQIEKFENLDQIDAVITYVNDSDPVWNNEKEKYSKNGKNDTINSHKKWRFNNSNEIKYCLLCIQKNCPFFKNIFIVIASNSQKCDISFLTKETQRKIKFITHQEFYYNKEDLPTFNSMSIEHNIHNIKGLNERFVYFNDDCFINKKLTESDFIENGKIIIHKEDNFVSPKGTPNNTEAGFFTAWKNTNKMLDTLFPEKANEQRNLIKHVPQIQLKTVHLKLKQLFPQQFNTTSSSKFRNTECSLMSAGLAEYYSIYSGLASTGQCNSNNNCSYLQVFVNGNQEKTNLALKAIKEKQYSFINIQSSVPDNSEFNLEEIYKQIFK
jgi:hypothetical protein